MKPTKIGDAYALEGADGMVLYRINKGVLNVNLPVGHSYILYEINESTGEIRRLRSVKKMVTLSEKGIFWIKKK
jgi:hypothetical protein